MLKILFGIAVSLAFMFPLQASALQIVYPADGTWFVRSNYLIIKGGSEDLTGMTVAINGARSGLIDVSAPRYRQAFQDMLILQPQFVPGRNKVEVAAYAGQQVFAEAEAEVFYVNGDPTATAPEAYEPFVMHVSETEALCAPCHEMDPDRVQQKMSTQETNSCARCHKRMLDKKHVHGPAGVYECLYCHSDEGEKGRYSVRPDDASNCDTCHEEVVEVFNANKHVHGPVAVGLCTLCHDPHATDQPSQLLAPVNELCLGCHLGVAKDPTHVVRGVGGNPHPLEGVADPSRPGRELSCGSCHNPHGGNSRQFFRAGKTSAFALCSLCHDK